MTKMENFGPPDLENDKAGRQRDAAARQKGDHEKPPPASAERSEARWQVIRRPNVWADAPLHLVLDHLVANAALRLKAVAQVADEYFIDFNGTVVVSYRRRVVAGGWGTA